MCDCFDEPLTLDAAISAVSPRWSLSAVSAPLSRRAFTIEGYPAYQIIDWITALFEQ